MRALFVGVVALLGLSGLVRADIPFVPAYISVTEDLTVQEITGELETMMKDIEGDGVYRIAADGVTLDCNNFLFTGSGGSSQFVVNDGFDDVTIINCNIEDYGTAINFTDTLLSPRAKDGYIAENTLTDNGIGILLDSQDSTDVFKNTITSSTQIGVGIRAVGDSSNNNNFSFNVIDGGPGPLPKGLTGIVAIDQLFLTLTNNTIRLMAGEGIHFEQVEASASQLLPTIRNNTVEQSGAGIGIYHTPLPLTSSVSGNTLKENTVSIILTDTSGTIEDGIAVIDSVVNDLSLSSSGVTLFHNSIDPAKVSFEDEESNITVQWKYTVNVTDEADNELEDVAVEVHNVLGETVASFTTPQLLRPRAGRVAEFIQNATKKEMLTPHTFTATFGDVEEMQTVTIDRDVTIEFVFPTPAVAITRFAVLPAIAYTNEKVNLTLTVTGSNVDALWTTITLPDRSSQWTFLQNDTPYEFTATGQQGRYNVTFFANTTFGEAVNATTFFTVEEAIGFNATVQNATGSGLGSEILLYLPGTDTLVRRFAATNGSYRGLLVGNATYDLVVSGFGDDLWVRLDGIDVFVQNGRITKVDSFVPAIPGGEVRLRHGYAIETDYGFSEATLRLRYDKSLFADENRIDVLRCGTWHLANRSCSSNLTDVSGVDLNTAEDYVEFDVTGFSAFFIGEEIPAVCGNNACEAGENIGSCPADCTCVNGATEACRPVGICSGGTRTCVNGKWQACEWTTGPQAEICNGADDDCNGLADDAGSCCSPGQTRSCGPTSDQGICEFGRNACENGVFGACTGAVYPDPFENCNDGLDNDCDGIVNDGCADALVTCFNGLQDENEEGIDCGGICERRCAEPGGFPVAGIGLTVLGILILAVILVVVYRARHGAGMTWADLKQKYSRSR